ncbi:Relish 2 [Frankliniella occidentalis]|nr:Relish 2 [Frankliniella occidentalis]
MGTTLKISLRFQTSPSNKVSLCFSPRMQVECQGPYLEMSEQPEPEHRFRYESEKTNGPIQGINSNSRRKTYPKVELKNHSLIDDNFSTVIRCELYTADSQPRLHVHELKGEKNEMKVSQDNNFTAEFNNLVVIRKRISEWKINEDEKKSINPSKIRLCFQAFTRKHKESPEEPCTEKIYSDIISSALPKIIRKNIKTGSWEGGDEMWLLVENIPKHTAVRFFKDEWSKTIGKENEGFSIYHSAIIFKTPQYKQRITTPTKVHLELLENEESTIGPQDILSDPIYEFTYYRGTKR